VETLYDLGLVYANEKNMEKAKEYWEKALKITSNHYLSAFNLGVMYQNQKDSSHACAYAQIAEMGCKGCNQFLEIQNLKQLSCSKN
jgi:Tfp pilus assembly protein PilF